MDLFVIFQKLGIALGLGLLVGMQREYVLSRLAGIRTFPVITVFGTISGLLAQHFGGWIIAAGLIALAALVVIGNVEKMRLAEQADPGLTTEAAMLLMYGIGAFLVIGPTAIAVAAAGGLAVLLQWKEPLHGFVKKIGPEDIKAITQFVLITLVILPVLPDQNYGPYEAFNPYRTWLMVVLIVGISLGGYVAYKLFGQRTGALLGGIFGGMISSTATTVSYAQRARSAPSVTMLAAVVILIASAVSFGRILAEIAVVASGTLSRLAPPLLTMGVWMALLSVGLYIWTRRDPAEMPQQANPAKLWSALLFGGLYAVVMLGTTAAKERLGLAGLYGIAIVSGLHDVDAITLSTSQLVDQGKLEAATGWRIILTAALSNLVVKALIAAALGPRRLLKWVSIFFAAAFLGGVLLMLVWPG